MAVCHSSRRLIVHRPRPALRPLHPARCSCRTLASHDSSVSYCEAAAYASGRHDFGKTIDRHASRKSSSGLLRHTPRPLGDHPESAQLSGGLCCRWAAGRQVTANSTRIDPAPPVEIENSESLQPVRCTAIGAFRFAAVRRFLEKIQIEIQKRGRRRNRHPVPWNSATHRNEKIHLLATIQKNPAAPVSVARAFHRHNQKCACRLVRVTPFAGSPRRKRGRK